MTRWRPEIYDEIVIEHNARGCTDQAVTMALLDMGYPVSRDDVTAARRRLGLPSNKSQAAAEHYPAPKERPNPVLLARQWLGNRVIEKGGDYWLDGRRVCLVDIMREFNRMRVAAGAPPLIDNPAWAV